MTPPPNAEKGGALSMSHEVEEAALRIKRIVEDAHQLMGRGITEDETRQIYGVLDELESDAALWMLWQQRNLGCIINDEGEVGWRSITPYRAPPTGRSGMKP
jgi:hypothetical protein